MATSEEQHVGSFHCLECGNQIKIVHGDKKLSFDLHRLSHNSSNSRKQESDETSYSRQLDKNNSSSTSQVPYTCQICNEQVEILYNDIKLSLQVHSKKHSNHKEPPPEDQMSNCSSKSSKNSSKKGVKFKSMQKVLDSIIDDAFITLPSSLKAHRGFILIDINGTLSCSICKINVDIISISDHLKTKTHEDNVIILFKNFISEDLHPSLDGLGFSGSYLVCNLCNNCKIDLSSTNPHETIVNIFIHNAQKTHISKKHSSNEELKCYKSDLANAHQVLQILSEMSPEINENRSYLDIKVNTNFVCRLCTQSFAYDDEVALLNNLMSHFIGPNHANHHRAIMCLEQFDTANLPLKRNHMLIVSKGSIYCKRCFSNISSDTKLMEEHVISCFATKTKINDPFLKQIEEVLNMVPSLMRSSGKNSPNMEELKSTNVQNAEKKDEGSFRESHTIDIKRLLNTMPEQFCDVGYIVEDNDGKYVKCLICDCKIPPSHYNLETHLLGKNHKSSEDKMKTENVKFEKATPPFKVQNTGTSSSVIEQVFETLTKVDPLVKANDIILMDFGDGIHYFCTACGDLIKTSTDIDKFKSNIYQHVTLASHLHLFPNQKKIIRTNEFLKDPNVTNCISSVDELFAALPKDLCTDRQFITVLEINSLHCSLCKVKVPMCAKNLQEHLEGGYHTDLLDKYAVPQDFVSKAVGFANQDALFNKIKMTDRLIMDNENYFLKKGEDYFCSLCSAKIKFCLDFHYLAERFLSHLKGKNHIQNIVNTMMASNPNTREEMCYVKVMNQTINCTKCDISLPRGFESVNIQKHVFAHFSGNRHKNATSFASTPSCAQS